MAADFLFDLSGRTAVITGGATGIGRMAGLALARRGANVAVIDLNRDLGETTAATLRAVGCKAQFISCDVTDADDVESIVAEVVKRFGRLDILVNSAGAICITPDDQQSLEDWNRVITINLTGTWLCSTAVMRQFRSQGRAGGKIINVASVASILACSTGSYDASKAAVVHLSRTLAAQWGSLNINVNCISPGFVGTVFGQSRTEAERVRLRELTPLGYVERLSDLEGTFVFLAADASNFITGQNLIVDGGCSLNNWVAPLERIFSPRVSADEELHDARAVG